MKKRFVMISLIVFILALGLMGCDWKVPSFIGKPKTKKEWVAERFERTTPIPTEVPTPSPTPVPTAVPTPVPTPTPTPVPIVWSEEYDDYFQREQVPSKNYRLETNVVLEEVAAQVMLSQTESFSQLYYYIGNVQINVYTNGEVIYLRKTDKKADEWYRSVVRPTDDLAEILGVDISTRFTITNDMIIGQIYQCNVVENEIIYDVIDILTSEYYGKMKVRIYINRDTQKIDKLITTFEEQEIEGKLCEIEPIVLPQSISTAKLISMEDFSSKYKKAIMQGATSAIGSKLWK